MRRAPDTAYLDPRVLVDNIAARSTNLDGIRRFYAGEGLVVFADDKNGMMSVASDLWLRPAATRRIGSYLDLQKPSVVGFTLDRDRSAPQPIPAVRPEAIWDEFRAVVAATREMVTAGDRAARLDAMNEGPDDWPWQGAVSYEYVQRLARGQRTIGHAEVEIRARPGREDTVDIAVLVNRSEDLEVATKWLRWAFVMRDHGFNVSTVALPEKRDERLASLGRALTELNDGAGASVASPGFRRLPALLAEVTSPDSDAGPSDRFIAVLHSSNYSTDMTSIDVIAEREGVDGAHISALNVYLRRLETRPGSTAEEEVVVALRIKHVPRQDAHLTLGWHAGKSPSSGEELTRDAWNAWPSLPWDLDRKRDFLLRAWTSVLDARAQGTDALSRSS